MAQLDQKMNPAEYESALGLSVVRTKTGGTFEERYRVSSPCIQTRVPTGTRLVSVAVNQASCAEMIIPTSYGAVWQSSFEYAEDCVELNAFTR